MDRSDQGNWARPVAGLSVDGVAAGAPAHAVAGKELTGPLRGFGKLWQKRYRVRVSGVAPEEVIRVWKDEFGSFWPPGNAFFAPLTGLAPGEVAVIKSAQGPMRLSTGVMVIYADDLSFTFMTPQGHPFAGWITFSADDDEPDGVTAAQVQLQVRAGDPLFEVGMLFGGSRMEDRWWQGTLRSLAARFGVPEAEVESRIEVIDRRRQWRNFGQVRHNAAIRSMTRPLGAPVRALRGRRSGQ